MTLLSGVTPSTAQLRGVWCPVQDGDSSPRTNVHVAASTAILAGTDSQHLGISEVQGRADWAQGLTEGEEFNLYWVLPSCQDHPPEAGIGSGGHLNNRNTGKELVVYR